MMMLIYITLVLLGVLKENNLALAILPSKDPLNIHDGSFMKLCDLKPAKDIPYIVPWKEIVQRTQGCSVPYYGPQGHGQFPEEVHIIQVLEVERLMQVLSHDPRSLVTITLQLDSASCGNKTILSFLQVASGNGNQPSKNDSQLEEKNSKKKDIPVFLKLQEVFVGNSKDVKGDLPGIKQDFTGLPTDSVMYRPKRPLVLLLTSDQPVIWQLKSGDCWSQNSATKVQAVVERDSSVDSDIPVEVIPKIWAKKMNRKNIQRYARRTYHGVASFTVIRAANYIHVTIGPRTPNEIEKRHLLTLRNRNKLNFCDFSSREDSLVVAASLSIPLVAESCTPGEVKAMNIFVIDVQPIQSSDGEILKKGNMSATMDQNGSRANLPIVSVHFSENKLSKIVSSDNSSLSRHSAPSFTIVLRSLQHTRWILTSSVHHGAVNVVVDENDSVYFISNPGEVVNISSQPLPESRADLIQKVLTEFSPSTRYLRIDQATGFTFLVHSPAHLAYRETEKLNQYMHSPFPHFLSGSVFKEPALNLDDNGKEKHILRILESEMALVCGTSTFEITLAAPILIHLGVNILHLNDRSCQSHFNGTHFILASSLKSCGSKTHTNGKASVISNNVYVEVSPPSGNGMVAGGSVQHPIKTGAPVVCHQKLSPDEDVIRSIFLSRGGITSDEEEEPNDDLARSSLSSASSSIYQLELFQRDDVSGSLSPIKYRNVIDRNKRIYVRAWMDDAPSAQAVIESCWISGLPNSAIWMPGQKRVLLRGMCPVEKNVQLEREIDKARAFTFSFQVLDDFFLLGKELYVHCQIGLCLSTSKLMKGKPVLCMDPQSYCLHLRPPSSSSGMLSTAHQVLTRGPLLGPSLVGQLLAPSLPGETKCTGASIFPYLSTLSVDMTIVIALASFTIGIGLTAALWIIHNKTDPSRRVYHGREHSLGSQSAVLGSSLSPHSACSSTNSQSIITS